MVKTLENAAHTLDLKAGQRFSEIGDTAHCLIGVNRGVLALHTDDQERHDVIGHVVWPGDWFGVASVLIDTPRFIGSSAHVDARVVLINRRSIERIAQEHPTLWRGVAVLAAQNAMLATRIARDNLLRSPTERCVATLDRLVGRQCLPCDLPITQGQFAEICGLSRGAAAKVLAGLERKGQISRGYASITVEKSFSASPRES
ncbi:Crp/Fnr family transcriptional regulator [Roseobacter denitrificans]|uniref:Transcriptional regulator, putative n=1 Tax=Roseobacter denitrificans (strain ATCC 33942 / OCh 114) TaxID=375451 RepID=Q161X3_ROSDO|nr:Crp/Fnr family transcriptional regulator [Roseobacter denitrificans]ABG33220.1 transcriptional regulator, putative [Roseobacter denitrificans OCh 114]